jgi:hypothetical protein
MWKHIAGMCKECVYIELKLYQSEFLELLGFWTLTIIWYSKNMFQKLDVSILRKGVPSFYNVAFF